MQDICCSKDIFFNISTFNYFIQENDAKKLFKVCPSADSNTVYFNLFYCNSNYLKNSSIIKLSTISFQCVSESSTYTERIFRYQRRQWNCAWQEQLTTTVFYPQQAGKAEITRYVQRVNHCIHMKYICSERSN